jgi:UDP-N-acetylglucosamine 2-epimerase (non-hydrolysing)
MDKVFFEQLKLPEPKYNLNVGSGTFAHQVPKMLREMERILQDEKPTIVLVEGDTNSAISGVLAASRCGILVGHLESGLRSYFDGMPEEINRVIADHRSDFLFAPTEKARETLISEGIPEARAFLTGNTIVDAVNWSIEESRRNPVFLRCETYMLATIHRQENTNRERLSSIIDGLEMASKKYNMPVVYPVHPRTEKMLKEYGLERNTLHLIDPVGYMEFLWLEEHARLILTDSGGVQEEACILHVPCVTLRDNTERPETIEIGANILAGAEVDGIVSSVKMMMGKGNNWNHPFGDGKSAQKIIEIIRRLCG